MNVFSFSSIFKVLLHRSFRLEKLLLLKYSGMAYAGIEESWKKVGLSKLKGPGIPTPSGQYRVGSVDLMHRVQGDRRGGLLIKLHYPTEATPQQGYKFSSWYPHPRYVQGFFEYEQRKFTGDLSKIVSPQFPALQRAPLLSGRDAGSRSPPVFPVIVFSHGLGGIRTSYSAIACDLASHGYVVACVEHRDASACVTLQRIPKPGGNEGELQDEWLTFHHLQEWEKEFPLRNRQLKQRADEVRKSLDILILLNEGAENIKDMLGSSHNFKQFKGCLDINTAAVMGHSFGGATTLQTLSEDMRFKCGLALDTWMFPIHKDFYADKAIVSQPLYFINSYSFQWKQNVERMLSLTKPPDARGISPCRLLTLNGTHHFNQSDLPFVAPRTMDRLGINQSNVDSMTAHQINMELCHAFLKRHLLKDHAYLEPIPVLDGVEDHSEYIIYGTNVDLSTDIPRANPWSNL